MIIADYVRLNHSSRNSSKYTLRIRPYREENTALHRYKDQLVNAV
jgi:hypothetical protein